MDSLAAQQDRVLERLQRHGALGECGPVLNDEQDAQYWLNQPGAPKPALDNEKPQGQTVDYETLLASWVSADAAADTQADPQVE
jgi:glycerol transport system substrate-binding protein